MKTGKRLISLILVIVLLLTTCVYAGATESAAEGTEETVAPAQTRTAPVGTEQNEREGETKTAKKSEKAVRSASGPLIGNDYIEFYVNGTEYGSDYGKFTIGNTGGNPNYSSDNNQILIYGHPASSTSFTTIRIGETNYEFFADETTYDHANLRAVSTMLVEEVLVTQTLQIIRNEGTGLMDTVKISYTAENTSKSAKSVGIRIMLDTMLGSNDGAPFKVPSLGNVTTEQELVGNQIPSYWQAFDNLTNASVFAVGTLYRAGDRKPDKVQFAAWPNIDNTYWDYTVSSNRSVTSDSAVAVYWNPSNVDAGKTLTASTYYGVGYSSGATYSTEASGEIPTKGFAVQVIDEFGVPIEGATVQANNITGHPNVTTDANGLAIFNSLPRDKYGAQFKLYLDVSKEGYQKILSSERCVDAGGLTAVTIYPDDGKAHISMVTGSIDGATVDLLNQYKYFDENTDDVQAAADRSNVKTLQINVTASSASQIDRYQLLQGGEVVCDSNVSTFSLDVLTGTPSKPNSYTTYRVDRLKAGKGVYLRVIDTAGNISEQKALGIRVGTPKTYGAEPEDDYKISFGDKLKITIPSGVPIFGDQEIELGWDELPFVFEISSDRKVKFAINPKASPLNKGKVDGTDLSNWDEVEKEYQDAMEQVALGRSSAAKAFGGTPQSFGAGTLSVDASIMGYGEGSVDDDGNITINAGIVVSVSEDASYTWTFFLGYVPVYISVGEKVEVKASGNVSFVRSAGRWSFTGTNIELEPKLTVNADGGVGANGVLNVGASGRVSLDWLWRISEDYHRVSITGGVYLVAQAFLFKTEFKIAEGTWTVYDSYRNRALQKAEELIDCDLYDPSTYTPIPRTLHKDTKSASSVPGEAAADVFPYTVPRLVRAGDTYYLFWLEDIAERTDSDRLALVYATSADCASWTDPVQVLTSDTCDYAYDLCVDGTDIHIVLSKANQAFGDTAASLDQMAAASDIYYTVLDTQTGTVSALQRLTENDYADTMPSVFIASGAAVVAYAENRLDDGLFGTANTYNVCCRIIGGEGFTVPVDGLVEELDAGLLGDEICVGYTVDTDQDHETVEDRQFMISTADSTSVLAGNVYSPTFAKLGSDNALLWNAGNDLCWLTAADGSIRTARGEGEQPDGLAKAFYVSEGPCTKVIWSEPAADETENDTVLRAIEFTEDGWSNAVTLFKTNSELVSGIAAYAEEGATNVAYVRVTDTDAENLRASLLVNTAAEAADITLVGVDFEPNAAVPGEALPLAITLRNSGAADVASVRVSVNGQQIAVLDTSALERSTEAVFDVSGFIVPGSLNSPETFVLTVDADGDIAPSDNTADFVLGYTDLSVDAKQEIVNGDGCIAVTVVNHSNIVTDATLRIIADEEDGAVLYEEELTQIDSVYSRARMLNIYSMTSGMDVDVFYVTVIPHGEELMTTNNRDIVSLGIWRPVKFALRINATTGGTIEQGAEGLYEESDSIRLIARPNVGYVFSGWQTSNGQALDDASQLDTVLTMPASDMNVTAVFTRCNNHTYTDVVTPPTCLETGYTTHICTRCALSYETDPTNILGHHLVLIPEVMPTCTEPGYSMSCICDRCGLVIADQFMTQYALGHDLQYTDLGSRHEVRCSRCDIETTEDHLFVNGLCACGAVDTAPGLKIVSANLRLSRDINLICAAEVPEGYEQPHMIFTYHGAESRIDTYTVNDKGQLCFEFPHITPQCMGDPIDVRLVATKDGTEHEKYLSGYSVRTYCANQLAKTEDETLITLLSDLLSYGAAAQVYTNYNTEAPVTASLDLDPSSFTPLAVRSAVISGTPSDDYRWIAATLVLANDLATCFTFEAASVTGLTVRVSINGRTQDFDTFEDLGDGKYSVTFNGITATEFDDAVTAEFFRNGTKCGETLSYSVNTYISRTQNSEDAALADLVKALYNYGASAKAYADANS